MQSCIAQLATDDIDIDAWALSELLMTKLDFKHCDNLFSLASAIVERVTQMIVHVKMYL